MFFKLTLAALLMLVSGVSFRQGTGRVHLTGALPMSHIQYRNAQSGSEDRKYFYLASHLNRLVMDVLNRDRRPGAHIVMWSRKEVSRSNQLWYHENNGMLRSQMNGLCIDVGQDGYAFMNYCHDDAPMQKWTFKEKKIQNKVNGSLILDISFYNRNLGARVAVWTYHHGLNQQWFIKAAPNDL